MSVWLTLNDFRENKEDFIELKEYFQKQEIPSPIDEDSIIEIPGPSYEIFGSFKSGSVNEATRSLQHLHKKYNEPNYHKLEECAYQSLIIPFDFHGILYLEEDNYFSLFQSMNKITPPFIEEKINKEKEENKNKKVRFEWPDEVKHLFHASKYVMHGRPLINCPLISAYRLDEAITEIINENGFLPEFNNMKDLLGKRNQLDQESDDEFENSQKVQQAIEVIEKARKKKRQKRLTKFRKKLGITQENVPESNEKLNIRKAVKDLQNTKYA